jgi:hypothetical protein
MEKGQIFGIDAMLSFTIMLFCVLIFAINLSNHSQNALNNLLDFELEEKAILITDSLIKNRDENNPLLGACIVDYDKKRVLENIIDKDLLRKAKTASFEGIFAKQIKINQNGTEESIILDKRNTTQCISVKRFVLIDAQKAVLEAMICRE